MGYLLLIGVKNVFVFVFLPVLVVVGIGLVQIAAPISIESANIN